LPSDVAGNLAKNYLDLDQISNDLSSLRADLRKKLREDSSKPEGRNLQQRILNMSDEEIIQILRQESSQIVNETFQLSQEQIKAIRNEAKDTVLFDDRKNDHLEDPPRTNEWFRNSAQVSTIAGQPFSGHRDGLALKHSQFNVPMGMSFDMKGRLLVADAANNRIRRIYLSGPPSSHLRGRYHHQEVASTASYGQRRGRFTYDDDDDDNEKLQQKGSYSVKASVKCNNDEQEAYVATLAGSGPYHDLNKIPTASSLGKIEDSLRDGVASQALFNWPNDICVDKDDNVYVTDCHNHAIRRIDRYGIVTTIAGSGREGLSDGVGTEARFSYPSGIDIIYPNSTNRGVYYYSDGDDDDDDDGGGDEKKSRKAAAAAAITNSGNSSSKKKSWKNADDGPKLVVSDTLNGRVAMINLGDFEVTTIARKGNELRCQPHSIATNKEGGGGGGGGEIGTTTRRRRTRNRRGTNDNDIGIIAVGSHLGDPYSVQIGMDLIRKTNYTTNDDKKHLKCDEDDADDDSGWRNVEGPVVLRPKKKGRKNNLSLLDRLLLDDSEEDHTKTLNDDKIEEDRRQHDGFFAPYGDD